MLCLNCMQEYDDIQNTGKCPYCGYLDGSTESCENALYPGTILQGRYIIGTIAGRTETDVVYHGQDMLFKRKVRIQEYFPGHLAKRAADGTVQPMSAQADVFKAGMEIFYKNGRELLRLYRDPDVAEYISCLRENGTVYAVYEDLDLPTVEKVLKDRVLTEKEALGILRKVLGILKKCQAVSVYHCSLSMASLWVDKDGRIILKDFMPAEAVIRSCANGQDGSKPWLDDEELEKEDVGSAAELFLELCGIRDFEGISDAEKAFLKRSQQFSKRTESAICRALRRKTFRLAGFEQYLFSEKTRSNYAGQGKRRQKGSARQKAGASRAVIIAFIAAFFLTVCLMAGLWLHGMAHKGAETLPAEQSMDIAENISAADEPAQDVAETLQTEEAAPVNTAAQADEAAGEDGAAMAATEEAAADAQEKPIPGNEQEKNAAKPDEKKAKETKAETKAAEKSPVLTAGAAAKTATMSDAADNSETENGTGTELIEPFPGGPGL